MEKLIFVTEKTDDVFNEIKNSKFNSLRDVTLEDIVNNWSDYSLSVNENIKTIKFFIKKGIGSAIVPGQTH
jgi:hypothetical protein